MIFSLLTSQILPVATCSVKYDEDFFRLYRIATVFNGSTECAAFGRHINWFPLRLMQITSARWNSVKMKKILIRFLE